MSKPTPKEIAKLKHSPIANFSLGSKELFHSNFLAWLIDYLHSIDQSNGNHDLWKAFWGKICIALKCTDYQDYYLAPSSDKKTATDETKNTSDNPSGTEIDREKNNIDLQFKITKDIEPEVTVVIENKVKSLPRQDQLIEYATKFVPKGKNKQEGFRFKNHLFILLTFKEPNFGTKFKIEIEKRKKADCEWKVITYATVKEAIESVLSKLQEQDEKHDNTYLKLVLTDYVAYIGFLIKIHLYSEAKALSERLYDTTFANDLEKVRLKDFYLKLRYAHVVKFLADKLNENTNNDKSLLTEDESNEITVQGLKVSYATEFTRGQALINFKHSLKNSHTLIIQLQDFNLRIAYMNRYKTNRPLEKAEMLLKDTCYFDFEALKNCIKSDGNGPVVYPKGAKDFNQYDNIFYYKNIYLDDQTTLEQLLEIFSVIIPRFVVARNALNQTNILSPSFSFKG